MRRFAALTVAVGLSLSFVAACLGGCLAVAAGGDHGCCPEADESFRAADRDCCSVVPGESHAAPSPIASAVVTVYTPPLQAHSAIISALPVVAVTPAASPPLVLRI